MRSRLLHEKNSTGLEWFVMTKRAGAALFLAMAALFLAANWDAYKSYFQDDDLVNMGWSGDVPVSYYAKAILSPRLLLENFRPAAQIYFRETSLLVGLDFPKYLPILHLAHLLNVWLVWTIARGLGSGPLAASLGTLFFALHAAAFDIYWKPMYVFDLLCGTFCLLSIFLYTRRRYVLSFCAFWLGYKSKELAVMLPMVLACYEFWFVQDRSWKRLLPFFAVSLSFGLQGLLLNPNHDNDYTFSFTPAAVLRTLHFYSSEIFLIPYAGLALAALPLLVRDRRVWLGAAALSLFFVPLLFLPGRLNPAYCYLPLAGLALMAAGAASVPRLTPVVALACAAWIPWNLAHFETKRREALAASDEYRAYVSALADFHRQSRSTGIFVWDGLPEGFHIWGTGGALRFLYGHPNRELLPISDKGAESALDRKDSALLKWIPESRSLLIVPGGKREPHLDAGWYDPEGAYRWIGPHAGGSLWRPDGARDFELVASLTPEQIGATGPIRISIALDGRQMGSRELATKGVQTVRWPAPPADARRVTLDIDVTPEYRPLNGDRRLLGVAVVAFGFR
jgi:hypothetical protein